MNAKTSVQFYELLDKVQEHISSRYSALLGTEGDEQQLKLYIKQYLLESKSAISGFTQAQLVDRLFCDMAQYSVLTPYLSRKDVEEINVNSWRDVVIHFADGRIQKLPEHFRNAEHCINIFKRLLRASDMIIDASRPAVKGHLSQKIRITAIGEGIIDEGRGISASIRIVNPMKLSRDDFIQKGTATAEMLDFISQVYLYGASVCMTGKPGSGKTTLMSWMLSEIPHDKRIYTVEEGVREFDLEKLDENGQVLNNVIHTVTRYSEDLKRTITMEDLLDIGLTMHPDYVAMAEMKSEEAWSAQEAARTGLPVVTTAHANSCKATYHRLATLGARKYGMSYHEVMPLMVEAFPIVLFMKPCDDGVRRIMEISECELLPDGGHRMRSLWRYQTIGKEKGFQRCGTISDHLASLLINNGMPLDEIERLTGKEIACDVA